MVRREDFFNSVGKCPLAWRVGEFKADDDIVKRGGQADETHKSRDNCFRAAQSQVN